MPVGRGVGAGVAVGGVAARVLLVLATLFFLSSMGGAMAVAVWGLVPLHWWAATRAGRFGVWGWAVLAGMSVLQAGWILAFVASGHEAVSIGAGLAAMAATVAGFGRYARPPVTPRKSLT